MRTRLGALSPRMKIGLAAGAVLVYAVVVWFVLVAPKRSEAASLAGDVAAAEARLAQAQAATPGHKGATTPAADVVRLAKAMPPSSDQAGLVLELSRLGREANLSIASIAPDDPTTDTSGATVVPVTVVVTGTYRQVTRFLRDARGLVSFRGGRLQATGRLFTVTGIELAESSTRKFPYLDATIALDAYAYDGPIAPVASATPPPAHGSTTSSGATAAGATP